MKFTNKRKEHIPSFDDIIFEYKNKEYGAYQLRKYYYKRLIPGIVTTVLFPLFFLGLQAYLELKQNDELDELTSFYDPTKIGQMDELYMQMLELPKKAEELDKSEKEEKNLIPEIVDSIKVKTIDEINENLKDTSGIESDTSAIGSDGLFDGDENGNQTVYYEVDSLPQFPGGNVAMIRFIVKNIKYPEYAIKYNITGMVYVKFCVRNDGSIEKVAIHKGVNALLDAEALRVVRSMPKWKPGKIKNRNVNVWFSLPINFNLGNRAS